MKHLSIKLLGMVLVAAALFMGMSSQSYAQRQNEISAWPDSVTMTTPIGTPTTAQINVWVTNVDSSGDTLNFQQSLDVHLTGSSQFRLLSDSILNLQNNYGPITVQYSPTGTSISEATLTIVGDSNTVIVTLIGHPINHSAPNILLGQYENIEPNQQTCHPFEVYNTNADSIWIDNVTLTQTHSSDSGWTLDNLVTLPFGIVGHTSDTMGQLCALASIPDTDISGILKIVYSYANTYGTGTDSTSINLQAWHRGINTTCVTVSGGGFGTVTQGATVSQSITLTNTTDTSVYLDSPQISGDSHFSIDASQFPLTIPVNSSASVTVTFNAPNTSTHDYYSAYLDAEVHGTSIDNVPCNSLSAYLTAAVPIPAVDSLTLDVPPGSSTISISARTEQSRHAIFIHNDGTSPIQLESLTANSVDSSVTDTVWAFFGSYSNQTQLLYDTVAPGATIGPILLMLEAPDTGIYNLALTLTYVVQEAHQKGATPASANSLTYTVVAHRLPPATEAVSEPNSSVSLDFTLSPNPARDEVTIGLPNNGKSTVEVYDVLGNLVMSRMAQGEFVWSGASNTGSLANGTYIVRVSQGSYTSSKRLVIVR